MHSVQPINDVYNTSTQKAVRIFVSSRRLVTTVQTCRLLYGGVTLSCIPDCIVCPAPTKSGLLEALFGHSNHHDAYIALSTSFTLAKRARHQNATFSCCCNPYTAHSRLRQPEVRGRGLRCRLPSNNLRLKAYYSVWCRRMNTVTSIDYSPMGFSVTSLRNMTGLHSVSNVENNGELARTDLKSRSRYRSSKLFRSWTLHN